MNDVTGQLTHAYLQQVEHYGRIRELVLRQARVMENNPDPGAVLQICRQVESLMAEIAVIEEAVEPAKRLWSEQPLDPHGELDGALKRIEEMIQEISRTQELVQRRLVEYVQQEKQRSEAARASMMASRARAVYRAG
jgi:ribosomal protein S21